MNIKEQFESIYHEHSGKVYKLCLGYASGDEALAKDWLQEVFIKVWKHAGSFKGDASVGTWIYRITVNTCLSDLRSIKRKTKINVDNHHIQEDTKEDQNESRIKKMYSCIDALSTQNKTLILMELEEVPQKDIAATIGIAHGALRTRLSRIRQALLKCITNGK